MNKRKYLKLNQHRHIVTNSSMYLSLGTSLRCRLLVTETVEGGSVAVGNTGDRWQVTFDTQHETGDIWLFFIYKYAHFSSFYFFFIFCFGIGATICTPQEIYCLQYARFNRPGVVEAFLQLHKSQTWHFERRITSPRHLSLTYVTCHMSHITCHVSHVTCHMSYVIFTNSALWAELV